MLGFGVTIALFFGAGAMWLVSLSRLADAARWNVHTYPGIGAGDDLLEALTGVQTATHRCVINGDESDLATATGRRDARLREIAATR